MNPNCFRSSKTKYEKTEAAAICRGFGFLVSLKLLNEKRTNVELTDIMKSKAFGGTLGKALAHKYMLTAYEFDFVESVRD